ncbi:MAG: gamma-glutamyltransferase, partial [Rhodospirillales bacterium]
MNDSPTSPERKRDDSKFLGAAQGMGSLELKNETFTTRPEIRGRFGVVTSTHWIATAAGMNILEQGGNAFDAACAVAFTNQVVEPHLNGPGGEAPGGSDNPEVGNFEDFEEGDEGYGEEDEAQVQDQGDDSYKFAAVLAEMKSISSGLQQLLQHAGINNQPQQAPPT